MTSFIIGLLFNKENHPIIHDAASGIDKGIVIYKGVQVAHDICKWVARIEDSDYLRPLNEPNCGDLQNMTAEKLEKIRNRTLTAIEHMEADKNIASPTYRNHYCRCFIERDFTLERVIQINMAALSGKNEQQKNQPL